MEHYYREFTSKMKKVVLRDQATEQALNDPKLVEADRSALLEDYRYYNYRFYGIRFMPLICIGAYVVIGLASRPSPFFIREIVIATSLTAGMFYLDFANSDYFWDRNNQVVTESTRYSDLMVIDNLRLKQMRSGYANQQEIIKRPQEQPTKADKMDD